MKNCLLFSIAFVFCTNTNAQSDSALTVQSNAVSSFQVQPVDKVVLLKWSVDESNEYKSFEIERADDGLHYIKVGSKLAISKSNGAEYDFVDATPRRSIVLRYRLKLLWKDGYVSYSGFKETRIDDLQLIVRLKQNPVRNNIEMEVEALTAKSATVSVVSQSGQRVASQTFRLSNGKNQLSIPSQSMLQGIYQLIVEAGSDRKIIPFVKE